jgi:DNA-binding response OmpR family regulator
MDGQYDNNQTLNHQVRVLIVEDTLELAEIIRAAIKNMAVMVFHEARGASALRTYHETRPDLVLLDIGLPDMSGWKLLDAIKETQTLERRPIVCVITAYGDPANRLMGKLQGVDSYLVKPFTLEDVRGIVQKVIDEVNAPS